MVDKRLFQKASSFTEAALTFIDDDGYPFAIPVSFDVDVERQLIRIRNLPQSLPDLKSRTVGIISIT
jgi:hypothetical protein